MAARCFALLGLVAVGVFASASQQPADGPADLEAAFATEGTACAAGSECDLNLLQLRAQTQSESDAEPADEARNAEEADIAAEEPGFPSINKEAIEAMKLTNVGSEGIASEEEAIEVMKLPDAGADSQEAQEVTVAQEEAMEAMGLTPADEVADEVAEKQEAQQGIYMADEDQGIYMADEDQDVAAAEEAASTSADEAMVTSESAGHCTAQDTEAMHRLGKNAFPKAVADCGKGAYKWFRFHQDAMKRCVSRNTGLGAPCASCFAAAGQYGFDNCKVPCLFGSWCSALCRGCTGAFDRTVQQCVGADVALPQPDVC